MARATIINKLAAKKEALATQAVSDKAQATFARQQALDLDFAAEVAEKQAAAVDKAVAILNEANVTI